MSKKKETESHLDERVTSAEAQAKVRLDNIKAFNAQNAGKYFIDPVKIPEEADVEQAQKDYEDFAKEVNAKKYLIADKANAVRVATFLRKWLDTCFWTQRFFVGVINFADLLDKFLEECKEEPKDLVLDYGPMQFAFLILENYAGKGLDDAKKMAEMYDEYVPIFEAFNEHIEWYKKQQEKARELQQRHNFFQQGFWYEILEQKEETQTEEPENAETTTES